MADPRSATLQRGYASIAQAYREQLLHELDRKPLDRGFLDAFAERTRGGRVIDVGCGPGHVAAYLARHGSDVAGLDLSPEMVDQARASHPAISFTVGDMFALPYADGSLRGIVAFYAIVHLATAELLAPFREFHRVLEPGGLVAVAFHAGSKTVHVDEMWGCATSLDFVFHVPEAVIEQLAAAGFTPEARLERAPYPDVEHPSSRTYLLARR